MEANNWDPWMAPLALISAFVLANIAAVIVDIPALLLGAKIEGGSPSPGLLNADTFVQDAVFVACAVLFARVGGRTVRASQFGLRRPDTGWKAAIGRIALLAVALLIFSAIWAAAFHVEKEKLLKELGVDQSTLLLLLSAALTCVVAPICEELLFRGFIFAALRNWRGTGPAAIITGLMFGALHVLSAPALDLVPLAALGFGLCLLYRYTGSLYPCIVAHSLNNSLAFGSLEGWGWQTLALMLAALAIIGLLVLVLMRAGLIATGTPAAATEVSAVTPGG
jgi:membrane protease YdiL (CAAX protease family)